MAAKAQFKRKRGHKKEAGGRTDDNLEVSLELQPMHVAVHVKGQNSDDVVRRAIELATACVHLVTPAVAPSARGEMGPHCSEASVHVSKSEHEHFPNDAYCTVHTKPSQDVTDVAAKTLQVHRGEGPAELPMSMKDGLYIVRDEADPAAIHKELGIHKAASVCMPTTRCSFPTTLTDHRTRAPRRPRAPAAAERGRAPAGRRALGGGGAHGRQAAECAAAQPPQAADGRPRARCANGTRPRRTQGACAPVTI